MLENQRLDDIVVALYPKAVNGDHAAAGLPIKLAQRRTCLMGLDMPQSHVLHVMNNSASTLTLPGVRKLLLSSPKAPFASV
jgi:hypothetical protein